MHFTVIATTFVSQHIVTSLINVFFLAVSSAEVVTIMFYTAVSLFITGKERVLFSDENKKEAKRSI